MEYTGIAADSLMLLAENRFLDSKAFYEEHKPQINQTVVHPLKTLVADMTPTMLALDPRLGGHVSRVRRDNRFTHDKHMYRENMWIMLCGIKRPTIGACPLFIWTFPSPTPSGDWDFTPPPRR